MHVASSLVVLMVVAGEAIGFLWQTRAHDQALK